MSSKLFEAQTASMRDVFAGVTASAVEDFSADGVRVTARPEPAQWPFTLMTIGFGTGLVVCVEQTYVEWAREHASSSAQRAQYLAAPLAAEGARRGAALHPLPPMLGWALSFRAEAGVAPDGYHLERVDKGRMDAWQRKDVFTNAVGLSVQMHRMFRNQFGYALFDDAGEPAAVAGVFDTAGLSEIGVDVAAAHQARGLSSICVRAACDELLGSGKTPYYVCEVGNIRSQHTALASGFLPACSLSLVMEAGMGIAEDA